MADEADVTDLPELETAIGEAQEPAETTELETEGDEQPVEGDEAGDGDQTEETTTIEIDGVEYVIPKALEGSFLKNKDYTTKSQANAERARSLETREAEIEERAKVTEEELDARATLRSVEKQLEAYDKLTPQDWEYHENQDPLGTQRHWRQYQLLQQEKGKLASTLTEKQNARAQSAQQDLAKRVEETNAFAAKNIPGFKPELTDTLVKFAKEKQIPDAKLRELWSPTFFQILHLAHLGEKTLKTTVKPVVKVDQAAQTPLKTVAAKSNPKPSGLDDRLSIEEWSKRRNAQVNSRR